MLAQQFFPGMVGVDHAAFRVDEEYGGRQPVYHPPKSIGRAICLADDAGDVDCAAHVGREQGQALPHQFVAESIALVPEDAEEGSPVASSLERCKAHVDNALWRRPFRREAARRKVGEAWIWA
jgi:hypothetical protein